MNRSVIRFSCDALRAARVAQPTARAAAGAAGAAVPSRAISTAKPKLDTAQTVVAGASTSPSGDLMARARRELAAAEAPHKIVACQAINDGKQLVVEFSDNSRYELHTSWLKDSSPTNVGSDFYRTSAADVWKLRGFKLAGGKPTASGEKLELHYAGQREPTAVDVIEARWLHAFAPFVGKALRGGQREPAGLVGTASLFDDLLVQRSPWGKDVVIPSVSADVLRKDLDAQVEFLENMVNPGVCMITGMPEPDSLERELAGVPMEEVVYDVIGKLNQHPVRSTRYGVMRKTADSAKQGADYDMANPLSMHTDHSVYQGTPGFLQFLYQAEGSVTSRVCDGLALAEYVREHRPDAFKLLTTVEITHSSRNALYTREGAPRNVKDASTQAMPFELVHTHPIVELDSRGLVQKVVQSETKRGVCALPFSVYEPFMEAYEMWTQLCEDPRFIRNFEWPEGTMIVTNNWRTLHGRATIPPGMKRTMCFGYVNKILVENRYRLLKQLQTERSNPDMDHRWLTRVPNQVLERMVLP